VSFPLLCLKDIKEEPEEEIMKNARIFGKDNLKPLTDYQRAVNEAAGRLATTNPQLLCNRGTCLFRIVINM